MATTIKEEKEVKDIKEKKRRRTIKTEIRMSSPDSKKSRIPTESKQTARSLFYYEENQAANRDPKQDMELFRSASIELMNVMTEIKKIKETGQDTEGRLDELKVHGNLQFITLKKLNRLGHFRCKKVRDATNDAKQKIDQHHLVMQNLLYEIMHLQKEITKCLEFKSNDEEINLVSMEEFYKEAPLDICKPSSTRNDLHQQTLARLDWEMEQRKRLAGKLKDAESSKHDLAKEIKTKKEYLESLQPKLNTILQATKPVQDYLGMPFDETREQYRIATYLPAPLYVLYMQSSAYNHACDKSLSVSIQGDIDVARAMESNRVDLEEDSDSDQEDQEKSSKKRRRGHSGDKSSLRKQKILKRHPLSVILSVKSKDESVVQLTFSFLVALEIVTVSVKLTISPDVAVSTVSGGDLMSPSTILDCLYPDDYGKDTPNPANSYALQRLGMGEFRDYLADMGSPYHWAQCLCGLQFLNLTEKQQKAQVSVSASHMECTIKRLRCRVQARTSLQKQLCSLERGFVPVAAEYQSAFPAKVSSRLVSWKRSTYDDFSCVPYTQNLVGSELVKESDFYFIGIVERGSAKMTVHATVGTDYPSSAPLFAVSIHWKTERNNLNDINIRDMETEVNTYFDELILENSRDQLLTNQIQRLIVCFDVYLETEAASSDAPEFVREKIFPRVSRGPGRTKPYRYHSHLGFFSQR